MCAPDSEVPRREASGFWSFLGVPLRMLAGWPWPPLPPCFGFWCHAATRGPMAGCRVWVGGLCVGRTLVTFRLRAVRLRHVWSFSRTARCHDVCYKNREVLICSGGAADQEGRLAQRWRPCIQNTHPGLGCPPWRERWERRTKGSMDAAAGGPRLAQDTSELHVAGWLGCKRKL